jgi:hypothetical protein
MTYPLRRVRMHGLLTVLIFTRKELRPAFDADD